ncbi:hypothetical protein CKF54_06005 [Psittacicella hinzii]|uniref:Uncharacterized protein n=1 Tax=Psittacicella hinzii TaxID=2028575 RepID=A0A3A1Y3Q0_9GAMM|nr:hypothetical protein [Psittacicella hinzii]RIY31848.1 hypothetical protein CKF54_06005 [Psittacicella hinzii]
MTTENNKQGESKFKRGMIRFLIFCLGGAIGFLGYNYFTNNNFFEEDPPIKVVNRVKFTGSLEVLNQPLNITDKNQLEDLRLLQNYIYLLQDLVTFNKYLAEFKALDTSKAQAETKQILNNFKTKLNQQGQDFIAKLDFPLAFVVENQKPVFEVADNSYSTNLAINSPVQIFDTVNSLLPTVRSLNQTLKELQAQVKGSDLKTVDLTALNANISKVQNGLAKMSNTLANNKKKDPDFFTNAATYTLEYQYSDFYTYVSGSLEPLFLDINEVIANSDQYAINGLTNLLMRIDDIDKFAALAPYIAKYPYTPENSNSLGELKDQYRIAVDTVKYMGFKPVTVSENSNAIPNEKNTGMVNLLVLDLNPLHLPYEPIDHSSYLDCNQLRKVEVPGAIDKNGKEKSLEIDGRCYTLFTYKLKQFNRDNVPSLNDYMLNKHK